MMQKSYSREFEASPIFPWINAAINDDNPVNVSWESQSSGSQKYLPFNFTRVVNKSTVDILFYPNQDLSKPIFVAAQTIETIDKKSFPAIRSFAVKRNSASAIAAGLIRVESSREGQDTDSIVARAHQKLLGKLASWLV